MNELTTQNIIPSGSFAPNATSAETWLSCPRDASGLVLHQQGRARLHSCEVCHGLWIAPEHLRQWIERPPAIPAIANRPKVTIQRDGTTDMSCPNCENSRLLSRTLDRIEVDACPKCHGLWLDSGELERIIKWHQRRRKSGARRGERGSLALDGLDATVNVASSGGDLLNVVGDALGSVPEFAGDAAGAVLEFIFEAVGAIL